MKSIDSIMTQLNAAPKLRLAKKLEKGGVELLGPKRVKMLDEGTKFMGKDAETGKPRQELKFMVEHEGRPHRWLVPMLSKNDPTQPHYLIERMSEMDVQVGDELILEMKRRGPQNYVEITKVASGQVSEEPDLSESDEEHEEE